MNVFGKNIFVGVSNNWRRLHHKPLYHTKRYSNESKAMPKQIRIKYHAMKRAGCEEAFIERFLENHYGY